MRLLLSVLVVFLVARPVAAADERTVESLYYRMTAAENCSIGLNPVMRSWADKMLSRIDSDKWGKLARQAEARIAAEIEADGRVTACWRLRDVLYSEGWL